MDYWIGGGVVVTTFAILGTMLRKQDTFIKDSDKKYVSKDICKILHEQQTEDMKEMKADIKELLRRNGGV